MNTARVIVALCMLTLGAAIVLINWGCVFVSLRNYKRGIQRHHSTIPIMSVVFTALAYFIHPGPSKLWMLVVPVADIANWTLLWLPVVLIQDWKEQAAKRRKASEQNDVNRR